MRITFSDPEVVGDPPLVIFHADAFFVEDSEIFILVNDLKVLLGCVVGNCFMLCDHGLGEYRSMKCELES